jgi:hypothetical protein
VAFFITLGASLVVLAIALNVGWIVLNWSEVALLIFGITLLGSSAINQISGRGNGFNDNN